MNSAEIDSFFAHADITRARSKDRSVQVGAVVVDPDRKVVVSMGRNGFPKGVRDDQDIICSPSRKDEKRARTIHAELNAILFAARDLTGHVLYVTPHPPCAQCAAVIIQSGIQRVYWRGSQTMSDHWKQSFAWAEKLFDEAGVALIYCGEAEDVLEPEKHERKV